MFIESLKYLRTLFYSEASGYVSGAMQRMVPSPQAWSLLDGQCASRSACGGINPSRSGLGGHTNLPSA